MNGDKGVKIVLIGDEVHLVFVCGDDDEAAALRDRIAAELEYGELTIRTQPAQK